MDIPLPDFRLLFDAAPHSLLVLLPDDPAFTIAAASDGFLRLTGRNRQSLLGRSIFDVFHGDSQDYGSLDSYRRAIASGAPDHVPRQRYRRPLAGGGFEDCAWSVTNTPVAGADGKVAYLLQSSEELIGPATDSGHRRQSERDALLVQLDDASDITERKQAEDRVRQQWHLFDTALSNTPDFVFIFDRNGKFAYLNRAALAFLGKPLEEIAGKDHHEIGYPDELATLMQNQIKRVLRTKQELRDQVAFTRPSGEVRHFEYLMAPVISGDGEVEAVAGSTRDVTDRIHAENLAEQDRRRWRDLLMQVPAGIAVFRGAELHFEWVNADFLQLVQRPAEALLGQTVSNALPELANQGFASLLADVYRTGQPYTGHESRFYLASGEGERRETYLNFVCLATRDMSGTIDGILAHSTDVTAMVNARLALEESKERFQQTIDSMPQLVWSTRPDGYHDLYNQRWFEYTGLTFEDTQGEKWDDVIHPDDRQRTWDRWRHSLDTGEPYEIEYRCRRHDGHYRWFLGRASPIADESGAIVRWFGTCTDIDAQKEAETALRRVNRELEEFSYVTSHDLQEPIRMVSIYSQLILKQIDGESDPELRQYSGFVTEGVKRMQLLIQDLLTFSRTVHSERPEVGRVDLAAAFYEAVAALKTRIDESGAVITAEPLPVVRGDQAQLAHVFQNLLSNSMKYAREGVPPRIHVRARHAGGQTEISVQDNGIGFEPCYAVRIFGLFKRLHKDEYPGTGLGLAICQRVVERSGGTIWAEAEPGVGATFYFTLPDAS